MTDQTAAVEVWARMLCAADVHVNDGDHIAWQQLPRLMQNDYRKAARWLLPRLTVAQPAVVPSVPTDASCTCAPPGDWREEGPQQPEEDCPVHGKTEILTQPADRAAEALAEVRRLCEMTIAVSVRTQAIEQARDTLAIIDRRRADEAQQAEAKPVAYRTLETRSPYCVICARQETDPQPLTVAEVNDDTRCNFCGGRVLAVAAGSLGAVVNRHFDDEQEAEQEPIHLRWGLNDVMWGDDDSVTVMLSGPAGEPYWLELDPERAAVLRQDLDGPGAAEAQQDGDLIVGYINPGMPRSYLCRTHGEQTGLALTPVTSDDLPDGGLCDECGTDVLIPQAGERR